MKPTLLIIGAGPIGIELAIHLVDKYEITIVERSTNFAGNVREWGHVRLFSPWSLNVSPLGLQISSLTLDMSSYPLGSEYISSYLSPLWTYLHNKGVTQLTETTVVSLSRSNLLKSTMSNRNTQNFNALLQRNDGSELILNFSRIADCSGTWGNPNNLGLGGMPAIGERGLCGRIVKGIPEDMSKFIGGKVVMVVGSGASAITFIDRLLSANCGGVGGEVIWVTRRLGEEIYRDVENDTLPMRDRLNKLAREIIKEGGKGTWKVTHEGGSSVISMSSTSTGCVGSEPIVVTLKGGKKVTVDEVVSAVGYRPDLEMTRELQVHQCYATEGPMKLAASLMAAGGGGGDCLKQVSGGPGTLGNPEKGMVVLGMKSYGRGSAFLIKVGIEQVGMAEEVLEMT
ncbi:hypothetical protein TrCOL_g4530 [Triparma columacea]|uniref:FAD/NAD(P)-binding domain-containing protein n=1 Tax=Triparma columacea TaxID=722753 RepID=A0A9W7GAE4_9STRA|nr:hypothetical protein TrCOL_g4530 [Triparma columacea]